MSRLTFSFSLGESALTHLRRAAQQHGAGEAELASLRRLALGKAELVDLERLAPLAGVARLPWSELFPELAAERSASQRQVREAFASARRLAQEATALLERRT